MVVDERVRELVADAARFSAPVRVRSPVTAWPGRAKRAIALGVHVQQVARAGPLVARARLPAARRGGRESPCAAQRGVTVECGWPTSPAISRGPQPVRSRGRADAACSAARQHPRACAAAGTSDPRGRPASARSSSPALAPAVPPAVGRRRRHAEGGRGRLQRHPALDRLHELEAAGEVRAWLYGEAASGPSFGRESSQTHSLGRGPDVFSAVHNVSGHVI